MALWTMFVEAGELRYSTQITATNARAAVRKLLGSGTTKKVIASEYPNHWPSSYSMRNVLMLMPVKGQKNTYLCGVGRNRKEAAATIVIVRTVSRAHS